MAPGNPRGKFISNAVGKEKIVSGIGSSLHVFGLSVTVGRRSVPGSGTHLYRRHSEASTELRGRYRED